MTGRPIPQPTELSAPYWEAARRGELVYLRCASCGTVFFPPLEACINCQSSELHWQRSAGRGTVSATEMPASRSQAFTGSALNTTFSVPT